MLNQKWHFEENDFLDSRKTILEPKKKIIFGLNEIVFGSRIFSLESN